MDRTANGESPYTVATSDRMEIEADLVVHGAGRVPKLDELDFADTLGQKLTRVAVYDGKGWPSKDLLRNRLKNAL